MGIEPAGNSEQNGTVFLFTLQKLTVTPPPAQRRGLMEVTGMRREALRMAHTPMNIPSGRYGVRPFR